jgi:hypothetical protein
MPSKPSHLDFGKLTVSEADIAMMTKLGYFREADKGLIRFGGEETISKPENDEVVVFKSFFKAWLRFPLHGMIGDVLENFEIYLHQRVHLGSPKSRGGAARRSLLPNT